jgi:alpha-mannosidase
MRTEMPKLFHPEAVEERGAAVISLATEEMLPNPEIFAWVEGLREQYPACEFRFAVEEAAFPFLETQIAAVDSPPGEQLFRDVEINPNNSGVWVTRIATKQTCRRQEYALLAAETLATLAGADYPRALLRESWQKLLFTMFHDALTATLVDPAYDELTAIWAEIDRRTETIRQDAIMSCAQDQPATLTVINPWGSMATAPVSVTIAEQLDGVTVIDEEGRAQTVIAAEPAEKGTRITFIARDVPGLATSHYRYASAPAALVNALTEPNIENTYFRITADEHGLTAIHDKRTGLVIAATGQYRPNELILERDEGSPWATLHPDRTRQGWAAHTRLVAAEATAAWQRLVFAVGDDITLYGEGGGCLRATSTVTLYHDLPRLDFTLDVDWDTYDRRLRVAMPLQRKGRQLYGIPYGTLERQPYTAKFNDTTAANGDWPAINWAGIEGRDISVALFNRGLPSYGVEQDSIGFPTLFLSVLRSPTRPVCLHEPLTGYSMTAFDGMRDAGRHHFAYALAAYSHPFSESTVVHDAEMYNAGLLASPGIITLPLAPVIDSEVARLAAYKRSEVGDSFILRLWEYRGRGGVCTVTVPAGITRAARVNLLERQPESLTINNGQVTFQLRSWEIATLQLA